MNTGVPKMFNEFLALGEKNKRGIISINNHSCCMLCTFATYLFSTLAY